MDPMGTWSNLSFPLVLIFDILLLHFGNICCALPTAHPESNKLRHESSQVLEVGMVTLWNSLEQKSFFINKNPNGRDTFRVLWSQQISPTPQKKHKTNPQRKISVLASLEPPLKKKKNIKTPVKMDHTSTGVFFLVTLWVEIFQPKPTLLAMANQRNGILSWKMHSEWSMHLHGFMDKMDGNVGCSRDHRNHAMSWQHANVKWSVIMIWNIYLLIFHKTDP